MSVNKDYLNSAVFVCEHVAGDRSPILRVRRDAPEEDDSGWQLLCGKGEESWKNAKIWSLNEAFSFDQSLNNLNALSPAFIATRKTEKDKWVIERLED